MALFDEKPQAHDLFSLSVDDTAKGLLLDTARWTKFLAIVAFVLMGLLVIAAIFGGIYLNSYAAFGSGSSAYMIVFYVVMLVLYFFPSYYLWKFSTEIKPALLTGDQAGFNSAISYLRNAFRFIGIILLIILGIYAVVVIVMLVGLAMR